ncbi:MAG: HAD-IIA family hydrolase [Candidatus Latescibacteria bacterium]|nr:HAD-IIA family hydrolase [Candidatus Latescibacterota bacterium]
MNQFGEFILKQRQLKDRSRRWVERQSKLLFPDEPERHISHVYLKQLEEGRSSNPSLLKLRTLSAILGINEKKLLGVAGYFDEAPEEDQGETAPSSKKDQPDSPAAPGSSHPRAHTHLELTFDTLPSAQGWTYASYKTPEKKVFSLRDGILHMDSIAAGFFDEKAVYTRVGGIDPRLPLVLVLRARQLQLSLFNRAFYVIIETGVEKYTLGFKGFDTVRLSGEELIFPVDLTQFHEYRLEGVPGEKCKLYVDNVLVGAEWPLRSYLGEPGITFMASPNQEPITEGYIQFGDVADTGGNAVVEIAHLSLSQPPAAPTSRAGRSASDEDQTRRLQSVRHLILDLDGTLCRGEHPLPGAGPFLRQLARLGIGYSLLTNNSTRSAKDLAAHLSIHGLAFAPEDVHTASQAALEYLRANRPDVRYLFVLGTPSLCAEVEGGGIEVVDGVSGRPPEAVLVGLDPGLNYERLCLTAHWIKKCGWFLGMHAGRSYPGEGGALLVDCGAINECLAYAAGLAQYRPVMAGKPDPLLLRKIIEQQRLGREEVLVVGDDLETDVLMAQREGVWSALMLTGATTRAQAEVCPVPPDLVVDDLKELGKLLARSKK